MGDVQSSQTAAKSGEGSSMTHSAFVQCGLQPKTNPITEDYKISKQVLGVGVNGKVVECIKKDTGETYALKVLRDVPKARREIELHWSVSRHKNIVKIYDVYENIYNGIKCLLVVMECKKSLTSAKAMELLNSLKLFLAEKHPENFLDFDDMYE